MDGIDKQADEGTGTTIRVRPQGRGGEGEMDQLATLGGGRGTISGSQQHLLST